MEITEYLGLIEHGITALPEETRGALYRACAEKCVGNTVLPEQQRLFAECGSYDKMIEKGGISDLYGEIIVPGHEYIIGYPRCLCALAKPGDTSAGRCECSRQSILYILHELMPDRQISVEILHTVLSGAENCRFRVLIA